jgi:hypothetical protein
MSANPALSEIERLNRNEQIARWNDNENALAKRLVEQLAQDFAEQDKSPRAAEIIQSGDDVAQPNNFINWCKQQEVRSCPAKPSTVAAYIREYREHKDREDLVLAKLTAISAMHGRHGLSSPVHTAVVRTVLETMFRDEAPRSWKPSEKELFLFLPVEIRLTILRREKDREKQLRRMQNELADAHKKKASNAENKTEGSDPKSTARHVERASDAGQQSGGNAQPV